MTLIRESFDASCTPEALFAFATDIEARPRWQKHLASADLLTEGPVAQGSQFRDAGKFGATTLEVTSHEQPGRFTYRNVDGPFDFEVDWKISAAGDGSHLDVELSLQPKGFMKLLWPVLRLAAEPQMRKDFAELEQAVKAL